MLPFIPKLTGQMQHSAGMGAQLLQHLMILLQHCFKPSQRTQPLPICWPLEDWDGALKQGEPRHPRPLLGLPLLSG